MRKKEFMEELCGLLAEFKMVGYPSLSAFPCICGKNKLADDSAEVCEETAKKIFTAIKQLNEEEVVRCCVCNQPCVCVGVAENPKDSLYACNNPNCSEVI